MQFVNKTSSICHIVFFRRERIGVFFEEDFFLFIVSFFFVWKEKEASYGVMSEE